ncbi:MAG: phosphoribosylformylglycinamidine synthase [Bdellovibrionota bacterium]
MHKIFFSGGNSVYLVQSELPLSQDSLQRLSWALDAKPVVERSVPGTYIGPRSEMITPWSTNAVDIAGNMGVPGVKRIEQFQAVSEPNPVCDPMLESIYEALTVDSLDINAEPAPDRDVDDIRESNKKDGLALSDEEIVFLEAASKKLGRKFTESELYGFAQINSEHCRHKIFNGTFLVDGKPMPKTLFACIKETSKKSPQELVSAYKDNVAFIRGPEVVQFAPNGETAGSAPDYFELREIPSVISLKAETHNFPTTVEPFYGASTGSGGEIRDRMAGGIGSIPLVGTAVYMTAYSRLSGSRAVSWEKHTRPRNWKYQTPQQILTKASNGASDFGNKFGQPLITGSVLTCELKTARAFYGYDRVIMLAGGVGYANAEHAEKRTAKPGDKVVLLGGDNYRIGMAGGSVSSVDTGKYSTALELSAVQRANPEMQKRVFNVVRALSEAKRNPIKLIHDHGAGGHINCLSELLDPEGGRIDIGRLPVGDPTLSSKEIICNESQERMGLIVAAEDIPLLEAIAERERAPMYVVGEVTGSKRLEFVRESGKAPVDLPLEVLFGSAPKTVLDDRTVPLEAEELRYSIESGAELLEMLENVLSLEAVACKDWLTNKVDRSVTGRIALQQTTGPLQLPLNNAGVVALDYSGRHGISTALGHAPVPGLLDERRGSILSVAEALTNLVWTPLAGGLKSVVLSANWMWPAKQKGEDVRLYRAVEALGNFANELGIAVPTGKDSLSMTMNYADGQSVRAPGTVIITAVGHCGDIGGCVTPDLKPHQGAKLLLVDLSGMRSSPLGGSSFAQALGQLGDEAPTVEDAKKFADGFELLQALVREGVILAGHDVSSGGVVCAALEMAFAGDIGIELNFSGSSQSIVEQLFTEKPAVLLQIEPEKVSAIEERFARIGLKTHQIGASRGTMFRLHAGELTISKSIAELRRTWFKQSYLLDSKQTKAPLAKERFESFDQHRLSYVLPHGFTGSPKDLNVDLNRRNATGVKAAIIRDKGTNGDRELAFSLYAAGFDVKDVTMSDLVAGRETLDDISFLAFPGGFSNSDVLGSATGWAGTFRYNERADSTLRRFYARKDTLSIGVCNGCQVATALQLIYPEDAAHPKMLHNDSGKFESTFVAVKIENTKSVMLQPLLGCQLGIWVAHGEGRFSFPEDESRYDIAAKFVSSSYPANPNGSQFNAAAICSRDGRHLAIMPHLERSIFAWNWPYRGEEFPKQAHLTPWMMAFVAAKDWITSAAAQ